MPTYEKKVYMDRDKADAITAVCANGDASLPPLGTYYSMEVPFDDGCRVVLQCCVGECPGESDGWVEGRLYDAVGKQLDRTNECSGILGDFKLYGSRTDDGESRVYVVHVGITGSPQRYCTTFDVAFTLEHAYEDTSLIPPELVLAAMARRLAYLQTRSAEVMDAVGEIDTQAIYP